MSTSTSTRTASMPMSAPMRTRASKTAVPAVAWRRWPSTAHAREQDSSSSLAPGCADERREGPE
jgi:hypothetical protein